jgi:hypothetical protein
VERRYKFWCRVIEREAEVENDSGKVIGYEDRVKILSSGKRLAGALNKKQKKHDLSLRDVEIEREGTGWDTDYNVEWVDESDAPLTDEEVKMIEDSSIDLDRYATIPEFDDFYELPGRDEDDDDEDSGRKSIRRGSAFADRKGRGRSSSRDGDSSDDDDDDDRPRRRVKSRGGLADIKARKQRENGGTGRPAIRRQRRTR